MVKDKDPIIEIYEKLDRRITQALIAFLVILFVIFAVVYVRIIFKI